MILGWIRIGLADLRGDLRHFGLLLASLALGTCLVAAIGSIGAGLANAVQRDARVLAGGDLEATPIGRLATPDEEARLADLGTIVRIVDTTAMTTAGEYNGLADVLAVSGNYPAAGWLVSPQLPADSLPTTLLDQRGERFGAIVDPRLLDQLGVSLGGEFLLGGSSFEVRGILSALPDGAARGFQLGYPLVISLDAYLALPEWRSPLPGLLTHDRHKLLIGTTPLNETVDAIRRELPAWRIRMPAEVVGDLARYYDLFTKFTLFVGLSSLIIGGVGFWNGVTSYLADRWGSVAILRSLGATTPRLIVHFLTQIGVLSTIGVGAGIALGALIAALALPLIGRTFAADLPSAIYPAPLAVATAFGLLVGFGFSYLPLTRASRVSPAVLFRSLAPDGVAARFDWTAIIPVALAILMAIVLAATVTGDPVLVLVIGAGGAGIGLLLQGAGSGLRWLLRRLPQLRSTPARWAVRSICAPSATASVTVLSVGLGLAVLLSIGLVGSNLSTQLLRGVREEAPDFILPGLFDDEVSQLNRLVADNGDLDRVDATPMLSADIVSVKGIDPKMIPNLSEEAEFMLSGSVPITFSAAVPARSRVVEGEWWPANYDGPPLVSLRDTMSSQLGLRLGDTIVLDVLGDRITARVSSFRAFAWEGGSNLMVTLPPSALAGYPFTTMAAVRAAPGRERAAEVALVSAFPHTSIVPVGDALEQAEGVLSGLRSAIEFIVAVVVANGILTLASAIGSGRHQREADAQVTKVLGATRAEIVAAFAIEFAFLGLFAGALAAFFGIVAAWVITRSALQVPFAIDTALLAVIVAGAPAIVLAVGTATMWRAVSARPAQYLRDV
jgi:putative ABC transport system permease protein